MSLDRNCSGCSASFGDDAGAPYHRLGRSTAWAPVAVGPGNGWSRTRLRPGLSSRPDPLPPHRASSEDVGRAAGGRHRAWVASVGTTTSDGVVTPHAGGEAVRLRSSIAAGTRAGFAVPLRRRSVRTVEVAPIAAPVRPDCRPDGDLSPVRRGFALRSRPRSGARRPGQRFVEDRDRIERSGVLERLGGVKQAFLFPPVGISTRLSHSRLVEEIAVEIAAGLELAVDLAAAIALAHDCGHPPGGHAGEEGLSPCAEEIGLPGFDHAVWGADRVLAPLGLHPLVLDGVRNHSWSRPSPTTPEAVVVAVADRLAYLTADVVDARSLGIVVEVPPVVRRELGDDPEEWRDSLVADVVATSRRHGYVAISAGPGAALAALRRSCSTFIYGRPASVAENGAMVAVLRFLDQRVGGPPGGRLSRLAGLTDAEACAWAVELGVDPEVLPRATAGRAVGDLGPVPL
jgi:hypothetical protein